MANMDRGRNLEALAEEDDEEEMEEEQRRDGSDSESSTSDDDAPDEGIKRGEPNKFDILCDGVTNAMALVHTALEELLDMKDEMLRHALPPTLLIKLATTTGKVFRGVSDLNMPVNELIRLVRVYSTPWEEKSAALKKLHEDYEAKQRQLNIAIKRLQLVDAHSKRIAREKRIMNWEKLFAKVMSNKGHGRRWKFLIETIKQKAKLGLEHVQEFTRQLDEESDEEEDDMPIIQLKSQGGESPVSASDKVSENETEQDDDDDEEDKEGSGEQEGQEEDEKAKTAVVTAEVPSIKIEDAGEDDEDDEEDDEDENETDDDRRKQGEAVRTKSAESKKVRFAEAEAKPKVETKDAEVWTHSPEYDEYLFVRVYNPTGIAQMDIKCSVAFGKEFFKTKLLDEGITKEAKESEPKDLKMADIKKRRYEEAQFALPPSRPPGVLQLRSPVAEMPPNCQITVHSGPKEAIVAMATIDIKDLKELDLPTVFLPSDHGDDDVPKTPEPDRDDDDDLDSLSSDMEIPLPGNESKKSDKPVLKEDLVKDSEPMMFPLYSLDGSSATHKPCGNLPLIIYWAKRPLPNTFNRQVGTHGMNELVFELTGIDLETTSKQDLHKVMVDDCTSVINFSPEVFDRAISAPRFTPENRDPPNPPSSPDPEPVEEDISPEMLEPEAPVVIETVKEPTPVPEEPREETIAKYEYDKMMEKHSKDMLFVQEEYEKRIQTLITNIQQMEQTQQVQQQQLHSQLKQITEQQKLLQRRGSSARQLSPQATMVPPGTPAKKGPDTEEVSKPIVHAPMPPQKPRKAPARKVQMPKTWDTIPDEFLERLQYFEDESYRHKIELIERTKREIQVDIEKKLAGQHKLSRKDEEMFQALNDVTLPALFMPYHRGTVFNPRAHQYFHPTGSSDLRLSQPPSVFQLPPLHRNNSSVLNLFELSKNFNSRGPGWLMDRYLQQQEPVKNAHGVGPQTSLPTSHARTPVYTPQQTTMDIPSTRPQTEPRVREAEAEC